MYTLENKIGMKMSIPITYSLKTPNDAIGHLQVVTN